TPNPLNFTTAAKTETIRLLRLCFLLILQLQPFKQSKMDRHKQYWICVRLNRFSGYYIPVPAIPCTYLSPMILHVVALRSQKHRERSPRFTVFDVISRIYRKILHSKLIQIDTVRGSLSEKKGVIEFKPGVTIPGVGTGKYVQQSSFDEIKFLHGDCSKYGIDESF
ncbi:hypothetical protein M8C21_023076, partial [Ambrosia artemisiifolia]